MANRRPNGEGSFFFDEKKQLYRAMITTPSGKRLTKSSKYEDPVKDWLNEQRLLVGRGQHIEPSALTVLDWVTTYVETYNRPNVRQRTYERNQSLINHLDLIKNLPIQKVTPTSLQKLYNDLEEEGFSGETRKKVHNLLHSAFKQAQKNRFIQSNPTELVTPPKVTRDEIQVFTQAEIDLLLTIAKKFRMYTALLLAVTTGMRLGEILGVRWKDIDLTGGIVHVRQNLQLSHHKGIIFEPPKTEKGKRKIPIPEKTIIALKEYKKVWSESKIKNSSLSCPLCQTTSKVTTNKDGTATYTCPECNHSWVKANDLVFVSTEHTPLHPKNFNIRFWHRLLIDAEFSQNDMADFNPQSAKVKRTDMLEKCRLEKENWKTITFRNFHALRHTYATTLLAANVPIVDVSRVLGHSKVSTTLDIYGHAIPENTKIIADKIANFVK